MPTRNFIFIFLIGSSVLFLVFAERRDKRIETSLDLGQSSRQPETIEARSGSPGDRKPKKELVSEGLPTRRPQATEFPTNQQPRQKQVRLAPDAIEERIATLRSNGTARVGKDLFILHSAKERLKESLTAIANTPNAIEPYHVENRYGIQMRAFQDNPVVRELGIDGDDVLLRFNGMVVTGADRIPVALQALRRGEAISVQYLHNGQAVDDSVILRLVSESEARRTLESHSRDPN